MDVPQIAIDAVTHYLGKGVSKDVSVGIVAVLYAGESRLNPGPQDNAATDRGGALNANGAYGIASWNGPRQEALANFAKAKGLSAGALNTQLDFVLTESANSYPKVWTAIQAPGMSYADFIPIFVADYENPKDHQAEIDKAMAFARELYLAVARAPTTSPSASAPPAPAPQLQPQAVQMEAVVAALEPLIEPIVAPLVESIIAGLARGLLQQVLTQLPAPTAAPTVASLPPSFAADVASEIAKLINPPKVAV